MQFILIFSARFGPKVSHHVSSIEAHDDHVSVLFPFSGLMPIDIEMVVPS
tara:strand:- start:519 stop:668 length:150 start_codon:yes stop_codon:yes gene_type:complete